MMMMPWDVVLVSVLLVVGGDGSDGCLSDVLHARGAVGRAERGDDGVRDVMMRSTLR